MTRIVVDDIKKEVIAFANCEGGVLYVGIDNDGEVVGVDNADETMLKISNMVRDAIRPDVTMFLHYDLIEQEGKQIVVMEVQRGTNRPYYLEAKGLRPEGIYVRQGTSSVPATDTAIRQMIKETDGDSYEEMRSLKQELTFEQAAREFERREIAFGPQQMKTLKMLNADNIYMNLGLLLSDQCVHTIKAAVFQDTDQSIFKDRREFSGSLLQQVNDVYSYINMHNQTYSTFDELLRIDTLDYPKVAVREALLNSLVHRDYAFRASTLISIYSDRIEFVSVGGLLPGIGLDDIMEGLSVCRNPNLANVFYRLQLIEAYGTGMRKIMGAYADAKQKPVIKNTSNAFKIILPNINSTISPIANSSEGDSESKILALLKSKQSVTRIDVEKLLEVSTSTALRLLKHMAENGILLPIGKGKNTKYVLFR